ncbi:hypothetical protein MKW92_006247, partial [Papaver armeniacum]
GSENQSANWTYSIYFHFFPILSTARVTVPNLLLSFSLQMERLEGHKRCGSRS